MQVRRPVKEAARDGRHGNAVRTPKQPQSGVLGSGFCFHAEMPAKGYARLKIVYASTLLGFAVLTLALTSCSTIGDGSSELSELVSAAEDNYAGVMKSAPPSGDVSLDIAAMVEQDLRQLTGDDIKQLAFPVRGFFGYDEHNPTITTDFLFAASVAKGGLGTGRQEVATCVRFKGTRGQSTVEAIGRDCPWEVLAPLGMEAHTLIEFDDLDLR